MVEANSIRGGAVERSPRPEKCFAFFGLPQGEGRRCTFSGNFSPSAKQRSGDVHILREIPEDLLAHSVRTANHPLRATRFTHFRAVLLTTAYELSPTFTMAGRDPATQRPRVGAANDLRRARQRIESLRLADARRPTCAKQKLRFGQGRLGGRVAPGPGEGEELGETLHAHSQGIFYRLRSSGRPACTFSGNFGAILPPCPPEGGMVRAHALRTGETCGACGAKATCEGARDRICSIFHPWLAIRDGRSI
jgi:hypothetical protein